MSADLYNQHTRAPTTEEVAPLVRHFFGAAGESPELQSLIAGMHVVRDLFADKFRKKRSEESIFWHNFRVTLDVYQRSGGDLLKTFIASQHDIPEDSRKTKHPYSPAECASLWNGTTDSKKLIADVLVLKTDEEGLDGDVRRARQHQTVVKAAAGDYSKAGFIFAEVMFADKKDNLLADLEDAQAGRLHFNTREKALEFLFKKISDAQIVTELPIDEHLKRDFHQNYEALLRHVVLGHLVPFTHEVNRDDTLGMQASLRNMQLDDFHYAAQLRYVMSSDSKKTRAYALDFAQHLQEYIATDVDRIKRKRIRFNTRFDALDYAFVVTAKVLTVNSAPLTATVKQSVQGYYDQLMSHLLYAGDVLPTVLEPPSKSLIIARSHALMRLDK